MCDPLSAALTRQFSDRRRGKGREAVPLFRSTTGSTVGALLARDNSVLTYSTDSDQTSVLLERLAAGDASALDRLLELHRDYLRRVVQMQMEPELMARIDASDVV